MPDELLGLYTGSWLKNSPLALGWQTGRYYQAGIWPGRLGTVSYTRGLYLIPTIIPNPVTVSSIGMEAVTGGAAATWSFGIYDRDRRGWPSDNLYRGTVAYTLNSTGAFSISGLSVALNPGLYWLAFSADITGAVARGVLASMIPLAYQESNNVGTALFGSCLTFQYPANEANIRATIGLPDKMDLVYPGGSSSYVAGWSNTTYPRVMLGV